MAGRNIGSVEVTVDANTGRLRAQLVAAGEEAGKAAAAEIDEALRDLEAEIDVAVKKGALGEVTEEINSAVSDITAEIEPNVSEAALAKVTAEINAAVGEVDASIGADVDKGEVASAITAIRAIVGSAEVDISIGADVDKGEVLSAVTGLVTALAAAGGGGGGPAAKAGQAIGDDFANALIGSLGKGGAVLAGVIANLIQPTAVAIEGVFGAAVAVVSSGMSALIGAIGALPPIGAGVLTSVGALRVGLEGVGDALSGDADALANLTPAARDFVEAFQGLQPAFDNIRRSVQERLFQGLDDELSRLATDTLPQIAAGLDTAATSLNEFFHDLADVVAGIDFSALFAAIQPAVDSLLDALVSVARTIEPFLLAAAPAAQQLAAFLADGAAALADMVGANVSGISDFLTGGIDSLKVWADLAAEIADALITLFSAGKSAGDGFVQSLADIIGRFDSWMESVQGQQALADFFDRAREVMADLVPLLEGAIGFFDRIITDDAVDRFGELTDIIGDLLPALGTLFDIVGRASGPIIKILGVFADAIALMAAAWEAVPDPIKDFASQLIGLGLATQPVIAVVETLVGWLGDLGGALSSATGFVTDFISAVPGASAVIDTLLAGGELVGGVFTTLGGVLAGSNDEIEASVDLSGQAAEAQGGFAAATGQATEAAKAAVAQGQAHVDVLLRQAIAVADVHDAEVARTKAMIEEGKAAHEAFLNEQLLAEATEKAAVSLAGVHGLPPDVAQGFVDVGKAARAAADEASAFKDAIDLLITPAAEVDQAFDNVQQSIADVGQALLDNGQHLDRFSQAGRDNKDALRTMADAALDLTAAQLAAGESAETITGEFNLNRLALFDQAKAFGASDEAAAELTSTLLGQPGVVSTVIETPGLVDALLNVDDLTLLYDEAGNPVITEFEALGIDPAIAQSTEFRDLVERLNTMRGEPTVGAPGAPAATELVEGVGAATAEVDGQTATVTTEVLNQAISLALLGAIEQITTRLNGMTSTVTVSVTGADAVQGQLAIITGLMLTVGALSASPTVTLPTFATVLAEIGVMMVMLQRLHATSAHPDVTLPTYGTIVEQTGVMTVLLIQLNATSAHPNITLPTFGTVMDQLDSIRSAIEALPDKTVTITADTGGASSAISNLQSQINGLQGKTIEIRTNNITVNSTVPGPGGMAGAMISGPRMMQVGERGYSEALVPLQLPLNRINPEVRHFAELIRGGASWGPPTGSPYAGPRTVVNQYFTLSSADPRAVAAQALNRAAAMATR